MGTNRKVNQGEYYNTDYYQDGCGCNYQERTIWEPFFQSVAKKIVDIYAPKTFLDVGCAFGYLVESLRDLGVEAYGVDISEYAISMVREDIRPFCYVCNAAQELVPELPEYFDCISTIEVIEHLHEEDAQAFLHNLCARSNHVIFSSTPSDIEEPSHFNVQQQEYWVKRFAREGFLRDWEIDVRFLSPQAIAFRREEKTQERLIEDYEHEIRLIKLADQKMVHDKEVHIQNLEAMLKSQEQRLYEHQKSIDEQGRQLTEQAQAAEALKQKHQKLCREQSNRHEQQVEQLEQRIEDLHRKLHEAHLGLNQAQHIALHEQQLEAAYTAVTQSFFWRATWPMRFVVSGTKKALKAIPGVRDAYTFLACMKDHGIQGTRDYYAEQAREKQRQKRKSRLFAGASLDVEAFADLEVLFRQREATDAAVKISVVTPLYNTPIPFLQQMIDSVRNQTHTNWELCLADGSDAAHSEVGELVQRLAAQDSRIRYRKLEQNKGISENTNAALEMAQGDYIALFDHDDLLHPSALYYAAQAAQAGADFIYTDELTFEGDISNVTVVHLKPDFAIDNLRSNNYICHLSVFKKELYSEVGGFCSEYDGSQDYDMILRLTERAENIVHIPHILYYWRAHAGSVASGIAAKSYCIDAAKKALAKHLERCGIKGEVHLIHRTPGFYKIDYVLTEQPLISILIPNKDQIQVLKRCIDSILNKSTYRSFEIIVIENNSEEQETFDYYEQLTQQGVRVEHYEGIFNYSKINNWGVQYAKGEMLLFLNNDVEVISPNWLQEMLMYAQREDIGAVGAKLYYPNDTVQHAGIGIGLLTLAGHYHKEFDRGHPGYMGRLIYAQNVSAVTAACIMMKKQLFERVQGFDESFEVAFNDVDLCLKIRKEGFLIAFTPFAELYHYESLSRGSDMALDKIKRFRSEVERCQQKWVEILYQGDPYYNSNFSLDCEDFRIDLKPLS